MRFIKSWDKISYEGWWSERCMDWKTHDHIKVCQWPQSYNYSLYLQLDFNSSITSMYKLRIALTTTWNLTNNIYHVNKLPSNTFTHGKSITHWKINYTTKINYRSRPMCCNCKSVHASTWNKKWKTIVSMHLCIWNHK